MKRNAMFFSGALLLVVFIVFSWAQSQDPSQQSQDQTQQGQGQGQTQQGQGQTQQGEGQQAPDQQQQQKTKKKGGFFSGFKAITGQNTEQGEATASAGSKSVGEGEKIGNVTPTAADRQQVKGMEDYSLPATDVKKFQADGKLQPQQ